MSNAKRKCKYKPCGKYKPVEEMMPVNTGYFCDGKCAANYSFDKTQRGSEKRRAAMPKKKIAKPIKAKPIRQSKYTKSARGQECQVRIPGVCSRDSETVVLAHLNGLEFRKGHKASDFPTAAYSCSCCHDAIDHRIKTPYSRDSLHLMHLEGCLKTAIIMMDTGVHPKGELL